MPRPDDMSAEQLFSNLLEQAPTARTKGQEVKKAVSGMAIRPPTKGGLPPEGWDEQSDEEFG